MDTVDKVNNLSKSDFISIFGNVFEKTSWIAEKTYSLKPFSNLGVLKKKFFTIYDSCNKDQYLEIFNSHPQLAIEKIMTKNSQKEQWLREVCSGNQILTGAWTPQKNSTKLIAENDGNGWRITGENLAVPACNLSNAVLVPITIDENQRIAIISLEKKGLQSKIVETTNLELQGNLLFDAVELNEEDLLDEKGEIVFHEVSQRAKIAICALVLGCCEEALTMTAQHVSEREQFGRPLSTNQGVALQAADAHIDIDAIKVTQLQAAWQLDEGIECSKAVSAAKWWASEAGQRVVVTTQHLHGGTGADTTHPIHRYFLWVIQLADTLDGAGKSLNNLGKLIAEEALNKTN